MLRIAGIVLTAALFFPSAVPAQSATTLSARAANRLLEQGTWGPDPASMAALQAEDLDTWFAGQIAAPVSTYPNQPYYYDPSTGRANTNLAPLQILFFQNALSAPDQLRQRVAFALSEIWVVSEIELNNASAFPPLFNIFQQDAFGNYEKLMADVTLNPAMGRYLNMVNNDKANPLANTAANENYAREIMQLFTLGLTQLHMDSSPVLDPNGNPVPTYTEAIVADLSKAFTGWTYPPATAGAATTHHNGTNYYAPMVAVEAYHDTTAKALFPGMTLPPGQSAEADLKQALHDIFLQPALPPFVSHQLIQHLVSSNPSPAYTQRVASVFIDNGFGVRGDMAAVIKAILTDPEARAGDSGELLGSDTAGHMREPILFVTNLLRALGGKVASNSAVYNYAGYLGQQLFSPPSVFSYFSPEYRATDSSLAPEMQLYTTQTSATRINEVSSAIYLGHLDNGTTFDLSPYISIASNTTNLIDSINSMFFHGSMSSGVHDAITEALAPLTLPADKARAALYVALTSSEYQIIH